MNIIDLYYFSEAAKDLHFTKTAERLYISQQNLSNHIRRLEDHYHVTLFERKPRITLTFAGTRMLAYAERALAEETDLQQEMADIRNETTGELVIGASTPRLRVMLPEILPAFLAEFPDVKIRTVDTYVSHLVNDVLENRVDIAFGPFKTTNPDLDLAVMHHDNLYIVCSDRLLYRIYGPDSIALKARCVQKCTVEDLAKLPFIAAAEENTISGMFHECFDTFSLTPNILMKTGFPQLYFPLYSDGTAAGFLTLSSLSESLSSMKQPLNFFPVYHKGKPLYHTVYALENRHRYRSAYLKRFRELAENYFAEIERMRASFVHE